MKIKEIASEVEFEVVKMFRHGTNQIECVLDDNRSIMFNPIANPVEGGETHSNGFFAVSDPTPCDNFTDLTVQEALNEAEGTNTIAPKADPSPSDANTAPKEPVAPVVPVVTE